MVKTYRKKRGGATRRKSSSLNSSSSSIKKFGKEITVCDHVEISKLYFLQC